MDDYQGRTIAEVFGGRDLTQPWTCSTRPSENYRPKPKPSAKTRDLIARLGLRYRPTNQADLEAHAGMLALLAEDLADLPIGLLERAIQRHCTTSPYMPKAADLIALAKAQQDTARPSTSLQEYADDLNAKNFSKANDWHWFVNSRKHENGETERYLDRKSASSMRYDALPASEKFAPGSAPNH